MTDGINNLENHVRNHLNEMKALYDLSKTKSPEEIYEIFLDQEESYILKGEYNFAAMVHRLHPVAYLSDSEKLRLYFFENRFPLRANLRCPYCFLVLPKASMMAVHLRNDNHQCSQCDARFNYETMNVLYIVGEVNKIQLMNFAPVTSIESFAPKLTIMQAWKELSAAIVQIVINRVKELVNSKQILRKQARDYAIKIRTNIAKFIKNKRDNLSFVSLDLVKGMYRQLGFIYKICSNFDYWLNESIIKECVRRYQLFIKLFRKHPNKTLVPTLDIDLAWHAHQVYDPLGYCKYTQQVALRLIDHDDTINETDSDFWYSKTFIYWSMAYKESYSTIPPDKKAWSKKHNIFYAIINPIYGTNRLYRNWLWSKHSTTNRFKFPIPTATATLVQVKPYSISVVGTPVNAKPTRSSRYSNTSDSVDNGGYIYGGPFSFSFLDDNKGCSGCASKSGCGSDGSCAASGCASKGCGGATGPSGCGSNCSGVEGRGGGGRGGVGSSCGGGCGSGGCGGGSGCGGCGGH